MNIIYKTSQTQKEFQEIEILQQRNHKSTLSQEEKEKIGFVTCQHDANLLKKMNSYENHCIAVFENQVEGYILAMTRDTLPFISLLQDMFDLFETIDYKDKKISSFSHIVVGQVCIGEKLRGTGAFDKLYHFYKETHQDKYHFAITEISKYNIRSLKAHARVGFKVVHEYTGSDGNDWVVVVWDWKG